MTITLLCLLGPTASGKTSLALTLADQFPIEIVSVDSTMVYRALNIGSAKPSPLELAKCPHHLIDLLDPIETYSAAKFIQDVQKAISLIQSREKIPLLVGGTMLYFQALQQGLSPLPEANLSIRQEIEQEASLKGWPAMHDLLQACDPVSAKRIHPNDPQRLSRALEVYRLTGKPLSSLQRKKGGELPFDFINILLFPGRRVWLHERIQQRFQEMLQLGLIEEVQALLERWPGVENKPAMRSVGYRQVVNYLQQGKMDRETLLEKGLAATRQLAKRQCTWLRSWSGGIMLDPEDEKVIENIREIIKRL